MTKPRIKPTRKARTLGPYQLLEEVGAGGMGSVYRGRHHQTGAEVAVKVFAQDLSDKPVLLKRFEREFRTASALNHPNVVRALDFGCQGTAHYLVMEFVEGESLGMILERRECLPESYIVPLIVQAALGLHAAHQCGVVHRDVKPDNILVAGDGRAKLTDLGLAKHAADGADLTRPDSGLGTPNFMAPEQFRDAKHADPRSDIYSLGATLYMAVTGELPFAGRSPMQILQRKMKGDLEPPRAFAPDLSDRTERAILRSMQVDPEERPSSCLEFIELLTGQDLARPALSPQALACLAVMGDELSPERRVALRYPSKLIGCCFPLAGVKNFRWAARLQDVSVHGLSLLVRRRFERHTPLVVELSPSPAAPQPQLLLVRVVRARLLPNKKWLLGCVLERPLREDELKALC